MTTTVTQLTRKVQNTVLSIRHRGLDSSEIPKGMNGIFLIFISTVDSPLLQAKLWTSPPRLGHAIVTNPPHACRLSFVTLAP